MSYTRTASLRRNRDDECGKGHAIPILELRNITADEFERWMRIDSRAHDNCFNHCPETLRPHFV